MCLVKTRGQIIIHDYVGEKKREVKRHDTKRCSPRAFTWTGKDRVSIN